MSRIITCPMIGDFESYLRSDEKSENTIEKYLRDVRAFCEFANVREISKSIVMEFKTSLVEKYEITSANSMIAAVNAFLRFMGWMDCCIKQFKVQKRAFCSEEKELTKAEYIRLVNTAKQKGNERLNLILQTICGTGIRVSELQFITVEAARKGEAVVSCKNKTRTVFIVRELQKKLLNYIKDKGIKSFKSFKSSAEIEEKLRYLQTRAEKAQECAAIYQKLGPAAYMCYAWDQELQAMGYEVHTRKKIMEMASKKPRHAKLGESKLPFYQWDEEELTQLYSITSECSLQVIVHEDGAVSMQTIADADNGEVVAAQHGHCSQLRTLHERLRRNWFILYDFQETESPDSVTTIAGWRASDDYAWRDSDREIITDQRAKGKTTEKVKQTQ